MFRDQGLFGMGATEFKAPAKLGIRRTQLQNPGSEAFAYHTGLGYPPTSSLAE